MFKTLLRHVIRIACITMALALVAPLLPAVSFHGSILSAIGLGAGLWAAFEISRYLVWRYLGIGKGCCPTASMAKKLFAGYLLLSVLYFLAAGVLFATPLQVSNIWFGIAGGVICLVGAMVSNIVERLLIKESAS